MTKKTIKSTLLGYNFVLPLAIIYGVFFLYPIFSLFYYSLFKGKLYDTKIETFVGFDNYIELFRNPVMLTVLKNNFIYIVIVVIVKIALGLLLALLLYKNTIVNKISRTIIFIPTAMSMIAAGLIWNFMYNPRYGLINSILDSLHLGFLINQWLGNTKTALIAILVIDIWQFTGFAMIILIAGIQNIPRSIYEAGEIDGTNKFTENIYITIPLLKYVFITVILFIITNAFKVFEYIYVTTQGGPLNSTAVLSTHMFTVGFRGLNITGGMTISVVLFILSFVFSIAFLYGARFTKES